MPPLKEELSQNLPLNGECLAISEGHGDAALILLKAGAETDKKDVDGNLAIDLAPDIKVFSIFDLIPPLTLKQPLSSPQVLHVFLNENLDFMFSK